MARRNRLVKVFNNLRKLGYFCKMNHTCCQSCGWAEIPKGNENKAVFYHAQDAERLATTGDVHLAWAGNGYEIVKAIEDAGMKVEWDGTENSRIKVLDVYGTQEKMKEPIKLRGI